MDLETHKVSMFRDVVFHENVFPFDAPINDQLLFQFQPSHYHDETPPMENLQSIHEAQHTEDDTVIGEPRRFSRAHNLPSYLQDYVCCTSHTQDQNFCFSTITNLCVPATVALTTQVQVPIQDQMVPKPQTYKEACQHPGWRLAMGKEIQAMIDNNT